MRIVQAVILAGGRGERLKPITDSVPKPMAPVDGKPFLDYLIRSLKDAGIEEVLLLLGYKAGVVQDYYGGRGDPGVKISFSVGAEEDATGTRVLRARPQLRDHFLLLYGDNYWPISLSQMTERYLKAGAPVSTTVFSNRDGTAEYGRENNVDVGSDGFVRRYDKSRASAGLNGVDIGYFVVRKSALPAEARNDFSFEQDLLPELVRKRELSAFVTDEQYYYITSVENLAGFEKHARSAGLGRL